MSAFVEARRKALDQVLDEQQPSYGLADAPYEALHAWSVDRPDQFWASLWSYFDVQSSAPFSAVLADPAMPGARWFPGTRLNYAEQVLRWSR